MPSGVVVPVKRTSDEDPATPPRSKRADNKDPPTRAADPTDPENVTLSQLQVVAPPDKSLNIVPDLDWAQSLSNLVFIVPDEWRPEYSGYSPDPAKVVRCNPQDCRYFYFSCDSDTDDIEPYRIC